MLNDARELSELFSTLLAPGEASAAHFSSLRAASLEIIPDDPLVAAWQPEIARPATRLGGGGDVVGQEPGFPAGRLAGVAVGGDERGCDASGGVGAFLGRELREPRGSSGRI